MLRKGMEQKPNNLMLAYFLGMLAVIGFGGTLPVTKIALQDFSPEFITFARSMIAAFLAILVLLIFKKKLRHENDLQIFIAGLLLIFGFPGLMAFAMQTVPASHGGVVLGFLPLTTAIIARLITEEKPTPRFWFLSLTGCLIVIFYTYYKTDETGQAGISTGDFYLVLAGLCASGGYVLFGKLSRKTAGWEITSRSLILNLPLICLGFWWTFETEYLMPSMNGFTALLYVSIVSMFLAFFLWNAALAMGGIARIGQLQLLQTFATLFLAALFLNEQIDFITIMTAIIITAIIAISRKA